MKPIFVRGVSNQFRLTLAVIMSVMLIVANDRLTPVRQSMATLLSPLQYLASVPGDMLDNFAEAIATRNMLQRQNAEMLRQQLMMSERLQRFEHLRQENERLRLLLGSPVHMDARKMVAEVMEVASDPFHQQVVINRGLKNGVYVGQPVLDAQGVVGQVVDVSAITARVLLMSDTSHAIPVRITRNDVRMIVNGTGELDEVELRHVAKSIDVKVGDLLVTSGLGRRFPEGYPVARVTEVERDEAQAYARVMAQPLAALDRIRYLLLIWPSLDVTPADALAPGQVPAQTPDQTSAQTPADGAQTPAADQPVGTAAPQTGAQSATETGAQAAPQTQQQAQPNTQAQSQQQSQTQPQTQANSAAQNSTAASASNTAQPNPVPAEGNNTAAEERR
ncbi:rod shape-determining protein MreC [Shewanella sp. JM162201]|uniref:Cell shape-determining protein MreC n=1 Tax=Shewanella jiangmenensis TaxID=2837387 RepID=A0ABS5V2S3_9GAMM|nr:rod shape-determining protein MreC [Shewanella jiangmenensis]MBT1444116.1 rod shape-determining protein MreC [Shewanella jiangmenensis]